MADDMNALLDRQKAAHLRDGPPKVVGPSRMGGYHGFDGFKEFSHRKAIYTQLKNDLPQLKALRPPYGPAIRKYLAGAIAR